MAARASARSTNKIPFDSLRQWNKWLAGLFTLQGVLILLLSAAHMFPIAVTYLGADSLQTQVQGRTVLAAGIQHLFDVNLAYLVAAFLFAPAIAHILLATKLRSYYEQGVHAQTNAIRWIEFAVTGGVMVGVIGLLAGIQDIAALLMIVGLTALMGLLWLATERINNHIPWLSYSLGLAAGALAWVTIVIYIVSDFLFGMAQLAFIIVAAISLFICMVGYAVNLYLLQRKTGNWKDYYYGERVFMLLGLLAKTALAWQLFVGFLRP